MVGIGVIMIIVVISGFCSVYLEAILKQTDIKLGIWHRNFQLALWSAIVLVAAMCYDMLTSSIPYPGLFHGWTINTIIITLLQAGGGLLVAATLKYADSILKTLAISGSIVLSAVLGYFFLGGQLDMFVILGCLSTIIAIFNYTFDTST
jgi:UDP-sugar transporter A1/2/3